MAKHDVITSGELLGYIGTDTMCGYINGELGMSVQALWSGDAL
jgi:hypothetical protein